MFWFQTASGRLDLLSACTEDPERAHNINRRALLSGALALPLATPAAAAIDPFDRVKRDAETLGSSMAAVHGGEWDIRIDHAQRLVLVISQ